ncbi:hypothetical protein SLS63_005694 [Diaporthe eres]|uniref:Uncharacterized protein n=1 Tax=Diaporthe eres TaxID=83184 RepID=A0ABR1PA94_DIAER
MCCQSEKEEEPRAFVSRQLTDDNVSSETIAEIYGFRVLGLSLDDIDFYNGFSARRQKRLVRKVNNNLL